jgi:hypothetical protein
MNLEQILQDKSTFTDNIELTIGTEKVTLGQLRDLSSKQQKEISDKIAGADRREAEARDTAMKAANLLSELEKARETLTAKREQPPTPDDFEKEEFWSPVRARLATEQKEREELKKSLDGISKSLERAATIWAQERWQGQYKEVAPRLKKVEQYKDWDYKKVLDYATEHRVMDEYGFPSIEKTVMELTKANDIETIRKEAYEKGKNDAAKRNRLDSQPRPSSASGGRQPADKSAVQEVGLEGLGDDAMNDPELMEMFAQIQNGGEVQ